MSELKGIKYAKVPIHNLFMTLEANKNVIMVVSNNGGYKVLTGEGLCGYSVCMSIKNMTFYAGCDDEINPQLINDNSLIVMPLIQSVIHVPEPCFITGKALALVPYHNDTFDDPRIVRYLIGAIQNRLSQNDKGTTYTADEFNDLVIKLPVSKETFTLDFDYMRFHKYEK